MGGGVAARSGRRPLRAPARMEVIVKLPVHFYKPLALGAPQPLRVVLHPLRIVAQPPRRRRKPAGLGHAGKDGKAGQPVHGSDCPVAQDDPCARRRIITTASQLHLGRETMVGAAR